MSDSLLRVLVDTPDGLDLRGQNAFFSGGEGWWGISSILKVEGSQTIHTGRYTPESLTTVFQEGISPPVIVNSPAPSGNGPYHSSYTQRVPGFAC